MDLRFGKMGGGGKTGKKIRLAAAAVCEMLEQRQLLDADSHTFLTQIAYSASEGSVQEIWVDITVRCSYLTYQQSLTAYYSLTDGTAEEGDDYLPTGYSVTLTGNMSYTATQTFSIRILKDNLVEGDELFYVSLTSVSEGYLGRAQPGNPYTEATVTITDNPPCVGVTLISDGSEATNPATGDPYPIVVGVSCIGGNRSVPLTASLHLLPVLENIAKADDEDLTFSQVTFEVLEQDHLRETYKVIEIPVVDDNQPEWLETALIGAVPADDCLPGACAYVTITDNDAGLVYQDLPEEIEPTPNEIDPGGLLSLNWDDDNANGIADYLDGQQSSGAGSDDDLQPVTVDLPETYAGDAAHVTFTAGQNNKLRLWLDQAKTQPVSTSPYAWASKPSTIYVEGIGPGDSGITMTAQYGSEDWPGHILWEYPPIGDAVSIAVLTAPTGFYSTLGDDKNKVKLNWTDPHMGETGLKLQWRESGTTPWTDLGTVGEVETTNHTLPADYPGKTYDYRIFSIATIGGITFTSGPTTTTGSGIALREVSFSGVGSQEVLRDDNTGAYIGSQWSDYNMNGEIDAETGISTYSNGTFDGGVEHRYPASYVRSSSTQNTYLSASPYMWFVGQKPEGASWKIKGEASGYAFPAQDATAYGGAVTASVTADEALPQAIRDTEVEITWKLSTDDGVNYITIGDSITRVYVTGGAAPVAYETVLDLGCSAADGVNMRDGEHNQSDQNTALDHIWSKFSGRSVYRVDHTLPRLTYYGSYTTQYITTANLLKYGDGQCGAWASLLWDTLYAQGVRGDLTNPDPQNRHPNQIVELKPNAQSTHSAGGFIIANWNFNGNGTSRIQYFPYVDTYTGALWYNSTGYTWDSAEVTDNGGVPGQGTANPKSDFAVHLVLKIWDGSNYTYYDPSYGEIYNNLAEFDATVSGYYCTGTYQGKSAFFFWENTSPTGDHWVERKVWSA